MDKITSRKNPLISHIRKLTSDKEYRYACREYVCEGLTLIEEAVSSGVEICSVLWSDDHEMKQVDARVQFSVPPELYAYVSPLKYSPGPLFTVKMPEFGTGGNISSAVILENVQDPGNIGTVIRSANAFGIGSVVLTGSCADHYSIKAVRASMGAIFRQRVDTVAVSDLKFFSDSNSLKLYAAALSAEAVDIRSINCKNCAFAVGNEGSGLSAELMELCDRKVIIPMSINAESLNAAVAASVLMWEMRRREM